MHSSKLPATSTRPARRETTIVKTLERVGRRLQAERGQRPISRKELIDAVLQECRCGRNSVIPSDYCYNRSNKGLTAYHVPLFLHEGRGWYRFVGREYSYTGVQLQKPRRATAAAR